jgi:hypothetical protein
MKHYVVRLSEEQADRIRWDVLQISIEFAVELEPNGEVYVYDERRFVEYRLKNPDWVEDVGELLIPEARSGDEITLIMPDGAEKSFELPYSLSELGYSAHRDMPIGQSVETPTAARPEAASYELKLGRQVLKRLKEAEIPISSSLVLSLSKDGELKIEKWPGEKAMIWFDKIVLLVK